VMTAAMLLLVAVRNALAFLVVWEVMSLASFFLVVFENEKPEVAAAGLNYLVTMHISVLFLIIGFALLSRAAGGALAFADFAAALKSRGDGFRTLVFLLFFAGFGIKAGLVPFHYWLPEAHPAAPTPVSALMSGVMIKLGVYGMVRILTLTGNLSPAVGFVVLGTGLLSAFIGIVSAAVQTDLKRLLAYSSVENIGIIVTGLGCGLLGAAADCPVMAFAGFAGGLLHVFNHSLFKSLLFYSAGAVYRETHTRDLEQLGGLAGKMPAVAGFTLIGCAAIAALPPLNGLVGELLIYLGLLSPNPVSHPLLATAAVLAVMVLGLTGAIALFCFSRFFGLVFLGRPRSVAAERARSPERTMTAAMAIMAAGCVAAGFGALPLLRALRRPVAELGVPLRDFPALSAPLCGLTVIFLIVAAAAVLLFSLRQGLLRGRAVSPGETWSCGYDRNSSRMQYTAGSFSLPLARVFSKLVAGETAAPEIKAIFPPPAAFRFRPADLAEQYLVRPAVKGIVRILTAFSWIQNGHLQYYLFYGMAFLALATAWILSR
ncbi:MAG: proton-conducting transporter membrane subunit, partial [Victivallaceae bacterium]|nr:proton-conducting transporter membrane subunit [Victivallaceae bacterium]